MVRIEWDGVLAWTTPGGFWASRDETVAWLLNHDHPLERGPHIPGDVSALRAAKSAIASTPGARLLFVDMDPPDTSGRVY